MQASQLIIPYGGLYNGNESLLVINLGTLNINSLNTPKDATRLSVKQLVSMGKTEDKIFSHLREHGYDKFDLKIVNFQVCNISIITFFCA
jgi:hypothetical protein